MQDKSGYFEDFNFKLIVIDSLLEKKTSFSEQLKELAEKHTENYEWYSGQGMIEPVVSFLEELVLTEEDLDQVTELCFDGGSQIYFLLKPDWDGEDDRFDVTSVSGFERLKNLKSVIYIALCELRLLDPLRERGIEVSA